MQWGRNKDAKTNIMPAAPDEVTKAGGSPGNRRSVSVNGIVKGRTQLLAVRVSVHFYLAEVYNPQLGYIFVNWFSDSCSQTHFQFIKEVLLSLFYLPSKLRLKPVPLIPNSGLLCSMLQGIGAFLLNDEVRSH